MSARARQETISRFSIPITDADVAAMPASQSKRASQPTTSTGRPARRKTRSSRVAVDAEAEADNGDDSDFVAGDDGDDSDFMEEDEDERPSKKMRAKGKGKAVAKDPIEDDLPLSLNGSSFGKQNPRVMLISLKAGALGLNLTVANNVFLYVVFPVFEIHRN